jgi:hypothetical protein
MALEVPDLFGSLEVLPVDYSAGEEDEILEAVRKDPVDVEEGTDAKSAEIPHKENGRGRRLVSNRGFVFSGHLLDLGHDRVQPPSLNLIVMVTTSPLQA